MKFFCFTRGQRRKLIGAFPITCMELGCIHVCMNCPGLVQLHGAREILKRILLYYDYHADAGQEFDLQRNLRVFLLAKFGQAEMPL